MSPSKYGFYEWRECFLFFVMHKVFFWHFNLNSSADNKNIKEEDAFVTKVPA